jgi:hypothetical protein
MRNPSYDDRIHDRACAVPALTEGVRENGDLLVYDAGRQELLG